MKVTMKVEFVWSGGPSADEVLPRIAKIENRVVFSAERGHNKHILSFECADLALALIISKRVAYLLGRVYGAVVWE